MDSASHATTVSLVGQAYALEIVFSVDERPNVLHELFGIMFNPSLFRPDLTVMQPASFAQPLASPGEGLCRGRPLVNSDNGQASMLTCRSSDEWRTDAGRFRVRRRSGSILMSCRR